MKYFIINIQYTFFFLLLEWFLDDMNSITEGKTVPLQRQKAFVTEVIFLIKFHSTTLVEIESLDMMRAKINYT